MPAARTKRANILLTIFLGALNTVSPLSIDMYLSAFPTIARDLHTTTAKISLSVSGYFIGLACGQLFYGPLLDRFGRRPPLYGGLALFIFASFGCMLSRDAHWFIAFRILQALGGCVAQVGALSMVRDFFPARESAKIISLLFLVLSVSPLFAPSIGNLVAATIGWPWIFALLAAFALILIGVIHVYLPEGHVPDPTISLHPWSILKEFLAILKNRQFLAYALGGAFSFAGLFVYVAGAPIIFINSFHLSPHIFSLLFACLACSFIAGSQGNIVLSRTYSDRRIFRTALILQNIVGFVIVTGVYFEWYGLTASVGLMLLYLPCCGIAYPNAAAIALTPFSKNVGSASALLGFIQMGTGALASTGVGLLNAQTSLPVFAVMEATAFAGLIILLLGSRKPSG
jgi:DHA1 family bicyclomycin/chloramphenicol resistance-like MFS transporter